LRAYETAGFGCFVGDACSRERTCRLISVNVLGSLPAGARPSLGHNDGDDSRLDLAHFSRYEARLAAGLSL